VYSDEMIRRTRVRVRKITIESELFQEIFDEWTWETIECIITKCGVFGYARAAYLDG
jgi:hypothetical protein